jgi:hypothetical protein
MEDTTHRTRPHRQLVEITLQKNSQIDEHVLVYHLDGGGSSMKFYFN